MMALLQSTEEQELQTYREEFQKSQPFQFPQCAYSFDRDYIQHTQFAPLSPGADLA